ncbi:ImmA/IrrE family metallo-endopeptidase [Solibacillus sp. FSL K6-1523]|uniref:ImmA/IrrE family metallo-endopeptidase n=1 Tax=Solibacillus sp. FSL K6-1523 TaxID=2921471 RepID=UPI0030F9C5A7
MKVNSHLEDFIHKLYQLIDIQKPLQLNIKTIPNAMDIKVFYWERTSEAILYNNMTAIFIDSHLSNQLQWQDFCHELCHPLLHTGDQFNMPPLFREYQEV